MSPAIRSRSLPEEEKFLRKIENDTLVKFKEMLKSKWKPTAALTSNNSAAWTVTSAGLKRIAEIGSEAAESVLRSLGVADTVSVDTTAWTEGMVVRLKAEAREKDPDGLLKKAAQDIPGVTTGKVEMLVALKKGEIERIQSTVDILTNKAREKKKFSESEKEFLKALFWCFSIGGYLLGPYKFLSAMNEKRFKFSLVWESYPEASELISHYMSGSGAKLQIDSFIYENSKNVQLAVADMKQIISSDFIKGKVRIEYFSEKELKNKPYMNSKNRIVAENGNQRLFFANNTFNMRAVIRPGKHNIQATWVVYDRYEYLSFAEQAKEKLNNVTPLPVGDKVLMVPDGLSNYLQTQDLAKEFDYYSAWDEAWDPK